MVDEETGKYRFRDFVRDKKLMPRLFEDFVFNFYRIECQEFQVNKEQITWKATSALDPELKYLPGMRTDISLRSRHRTIVIDTKYYEDTLQEYYDKQTVHSGNLYQIFAYLKNLEHRGGTDSVAEGILLYPVVDQTIDLSYEMHGHKIRICTIDLRQDWPEIDQRLRAIAGSDGLSG